MLIAPAVLNSDCFFAVDIVKGQGSQEKNNIKAKRYPIVLYNDYDESMCYRW